MPETPLLNRRLLIITGKGGTGKTTLCAALGIISAGMGKRTLIVEVNSREDIPKLFGKERHGYNERELLPNLYSMSIDPYKAMEEYLYLRLKLRAIVERITKSALYRYLSKATPGLKELATVGKVWHLCERAKQKDGRLKYDLVILDAPSTGHGIPILKLPQTAIEAIKVGPVVSEAKKVQSFLSDREKCSLNLITIPEEMPVSETIEFYNRAREELDIGMEALFVNMVLPSFLSVNLERVEGNSGIQRILQYFKNRKKNQDIYIERLRREIKKLDLIEVPWVPSAGMGRTELKSISEAIKEKVL